MEAHVQDRARKLGAVALVDQLDEQIGCRRATATGQDSVIHGIKLFDRLQTGEVFAERGDVFPMQSKGTTRENPRAGQRISARAQAAYGAPGAPLMAKVDPGKDTFVYMQNAEPISLFCADETDGESLAPCQQIVETLLAYAIDSGEIVPELATGCTPNEDSTVWICALREGVLFHDGTTFDANDVVFSWAAGIDASNPYHIGNTGVFDYYGYLWDGLMNEVSE